jgi:hypothetical protein
MTTLEYLKQYKILCRKIERTWERLQGVACRMQSISPVQGDGSYHGCGVSDKVGIGIAEYDYLSREYDLYIDLKVNMKQHILATVKKMPSKRYRAIIWLRYICFCDFPEIARRIHIDDTNYLRCRLHSLAIKQYTKYSICS